MEKCIVDDCEKYLFQKGYCITHYKQWYRHGDPLFWKTRKAGEGSISSGYHRVSRARKAINVHREIVEKVVGYSLPHLAVIHHVDENKLNNEHKNLVVCQDSAYHSLLHQRARALRASGHADWRKCTYCKEYDSPQSLHIYRSGQVYHGPCLNNYKRERRKINGAKHI